MSFAIYIVGFLILTGGFIYGADILHVPTQWIGAGTAVMVGLGILAAVKATRQRDPAS